MQFFRKTGANTSTGVAAPAAYEFGSGSSQTRRSVKNGAEETPFLWHERKQQCLLSKGERENPLGRYEMVCCTANFGPGPPTKTLLHIIGTCLVFSERSH